jgi:transposase-like protein
VVRRGVRYSKNGPVQRYFCKVCGSWFVGRSALKGARTRAEIVAAAIDLYYRGLSLRQIAEHLEATRGVRVSHGAVYCWISKYVKLVSRYVDNFEARTSDRWHADETLVKVQGRHMVIWGLLDNETRLLIATHISGRRGEEDAEALVAKGLGKSQGKPAELVTDGLTSYDAAVGKVFANGGLNRLLHLRGPLTESLNNKMERLWRTVKTRVKPMGGFHSGEGAKRFADGFAVHYNFVRPHMALGGKTPAQVSGLSPRKLRWLDLIVASEKSD